ncbi:MAG: NCS2 family permease [Firmicutes bacterium]|nr:NCS2 family permease [Candidatus Fermentithermobacillaceae bacterium]
MTMAYVIFVNPSILEIAGVPKGPAITATALAAGINTLMMGLVTNYPFAVAAGMGLNGVVTFSLVKGLGIPWQAAMGVVVIEGVIVTILVLTNIREAVMNAIPLSMKRAIGVGIGLFVATLGLEGGKIIVAHPATLVTFGSLKDKGVWVAVFGTLLTAVLMTRKVKGAILLGIIAATIFAIPLGVAHLPETVMSVPTRESFSTLFATFKTNPATGAPYIVEVLNLGMAGTIFAFLMTDFFDTMGTVVAIGGEAGFLDEKGQLPRIKKVLLVDSLAAVIGGAFGISSNTTYVESGAGVSEGGRTGLTSVVVAILFFLSMLFAPIAGIVPPQATASALIVVGFLMMTVVKDIDWTDFSEAFPAFITIIATPLTYSISRGIGYGFVTYVLTKALTGRAKEVHWLMWIVSALFVVSFFY